MLNQRLKVLITTNIPSPYMIDYLDSLSEYCDITAVFEIGSAVDRDDKWYGKNTNSIKTVFLNAKRIGNETGLSFKVLKYLKKKEYNRIIIANPTTPTGIIELLFCRCFSINHCIQSEGGFQGSGKGFKEKFKKFIMKKADLYLTGMGGDNDYFLKYGATKSKLKPYPFTSMKKEDIEFAHKLKDSKDEFRKKLGINENKVILSVGRFSYNAGYGKGYDYLMRLAEQMMDGVGFYIVGDEPTEEFVLWKQKSNLNNVHFIGFKSKKELAEYYAAADIFVLLTRGDTWGLVINEAMAYSLPVISSDMCVAGRELIKDGKNGFVVSLDSIETIRYRIESIINDEKKIETYGKNSFEIIENYYIENMAFIVYKALNDII